MTDQQINEAIARECGWVKTDHDWWSLGPMSVCHYDPPYYCNDLNEMHSAYSTLSVGKRVEFCSELERLCSGPCDTKIRTINATARQRAEAFLRVLGKWKDDKR